MRNEELCGGSKMPSPVGKVAREAGRMRSHPAALRIMTDEVASRNAAHQDG